MSQLRQQHGLQLIYVPITLDGYILSELGGVRRKQRLAFSGSLFYCLHFSAFSHLPYLAGMTISFTYDKKQVLQALRYHFLTRPEIRILLILVNVFAIGSAILLYFRFIQPVSFLMFSLLWFILMLVVWRILPQSIYRRSHTFKDSFSMEINEEHVVLTTEKGQKSWSWGVFSKFVESPYFFHLYFDARSFFLVPTDAFKDLEERQEARRILKTKINRSRREILKEPL